jgi:hypothetical protein
MLLQNSYRRTIVDFNDDEEDDLLEDDDDFDDDDEEDEDDLTEISEDNY